MAIELLSKVILNGYLGKHINDICIFKFVADNHCAHFVSHVLTLEFGVKCASKGRNIRVQEIFAQCPQVGTFDDHDVKRPCLVFVTAAGNVHLKKTLMDNVPKKHIGICLDGTIWHYSNSQQKVITQTPEEFTKHYPNQTNALFFGTLPVGAAPVAYAALPG